MGTSQRRNPKPYTLNSRIEVQGLGLGLQPQGLVAIRVQSVIWEVRGGQDASFAASDLGFPVRAFMLGEMTTVLCKVLDFMVWA